MVFNTDGKLVASGGDQELNGKKLDPNWQHSGAVDWDGNVYMIERDAHRIVKLSPKMDKVLLQLGTTMEKGNDATHFDLPSGIAVLKNGNIIVTDGYGNNRVVMFDKTGKFIKQVGEGRRRSRPTRARASASGMLPHKLAVDAQENLYIIDREGHRVQVFDKNLNYLREINVPGWNPWDIGISRKGDDGFAYIADHALERVHKLSLKDGKLVATWGKQGLGPGEFDWVHGIVVDSKGAVYAADTYGQRIQKFVPLGNDLESVGLRAVVCGPRRSDRRLRLQHDLDALHRCDRLARDPRRLVLPLAHGLQQDWIVDRVHGLDDARAGDVAALVDLQLHHIRGIRRCRAPRSKTAAAANPVSTPRVPCWAAPRAGRGWRSCDLRRGAAPRGGRGCRRRGGGFAQIEKP